MTLPKGFKTLSRNMQNRMFNEWWATIPEQLRQKSRSGDEDNKPLLNQINYVLLCLHLAGKHDAKPTYDELKYWLHTGQIDIIRLETFANKNKREKLQVPSRYEFT